MAAQGKKLAAQEKKLAAQGKKLAAQKKKLAAQENINGCAGKYKRLRFVRLLYFFSDTHH